MNPKLSTAEAARVLGLRELQVRELARRVLARKRGRNRRYAFDFRDMVVLRAAARLLERRVPAARVSRALARLLERLPEDQPLSGVRIDCAGRRVAVRDGERHWDPETGQILLEFEAAEPDSSAAPALVARLAPAPATDEASRALLEFERGLDLEECDVTAAAGAYGRALELDPDFADAYINLGRLAHEAGRLPEAIQLYQQALERRADDPIAHFNLALATEDHSGAERAIALYQRALELDPGFADAHFNLANLFERSGRAQEAIRHYHSYRRLTEAKS
jgi:tetratricopeptide (TPR) repeat protein